MLSHSLKGKTFHSICKAKSTNLNSLYELNFSANAKLEALNRSHTNESKKLMAQLKKEEISRQSIMEQLAQKTKENTELVKICDELINNGADGS